MLVLSRKVGERVVIGENITVVVARLAGNRVTIGIEAPPDVRIVRGELNPSVPAHARQHSPSAVLVGAFAGGADAVAASVPRLAK
jgi:carbon storage regulator